MRRVSLRSYYSIEDTFNLTGIYTLEWVSLGAGSVMLAGSSASGAITQLQLLEGQDLDVLTISWGLAASLSTWAHEGISADVQGQGYMLSVESLTGNVMVQQMNASSLAAPTTLQTVSGSFVHATQIEMLNIAGQTYLAAAQIGGGGLVIYQVQAGFQLSQVSAVVDTDKSHASDIADLQAVTVGTSTFLISISATENGISSYQINPDGSSQLVDSIGPKSGFWVAGLSAVLPIEVDGQTFLITTASQSNSLAAVRLNERGVFFITDIVTDTRDTRFAGASALDSFEVDGRDFIVVGGTDGGVSLFELLPEGQLFHHQSLAQSLEWNIGAIGEISAVILGNEVQIIVTGAGQGGVAQLVLSLSDFGLRRIGTAAGNQINGGAGDDVLLGMAGNDRLQGGAGEDVLFAGTGADILIGGAGADIFVFTADGQTDQINDFEIGTDQLHLADWGRVYDISTLNITRESFGATISWQGEMINIYAANGGPIETSDWNMDSFIF